MMKLKDIKTMLKTTGFPVAYQSFPAEQCPEMPFIVWQETGTHNFGADNRVWSSARILQIDLFTAKRDEESEEILQNVLNNTDIFWTKETGYDVDEKFTRITYECEV